MNRLSQYLLARWKIIPSPKDQFEPTISKARILVVAISLFAVGLGMFYLFVIWMIQGRQMLIYLFGEELSLEKVQDHVDIYFAGMITTLFLYKATTAFLLWCLIEWALKLFRNWLILAPDCNYKTPALLLFSFICIPVSVVFTPFVFWVLYINCIPDSSPSSQKNFFYSYVGWRCSLFSLCFLGLIYLAVGGFDRFETGLDFSPHYIFSLTGVVAVLLFSMAYCWSSMILEISRLQHEKYRESSMQSEEKCKSCGEPLTTDNSPCPMCGQRNT
ncbi:hypothetical protein Pla110_16830 [Polystyrenella longa]|uniref:Uncharacterized protein n=1 Tax=Polystyrenella longa TaxID=2528007 RepID=A0A518CL64_9PLAN|nr:hypothetical protein [Polystyrenella longa]QDU79961.1 hypothetical protein Pla110_16830 [Polystyrenella longa]